MLRWFSGSGFVAYGSAATKYFGSCGNVVDLMNGGFRII